MKTLAGLALLLISLTLALPSYAAEKTTKVTYKWVDDNNITQFTERPPKDRAYEKIIVTSSGGREVQEVSKTQAVSDAKKSTNSSLDEFQQANERNCTIARQNMEVLQNMARIRVTENGEERILSPEEKQARVEETQKQIDIYCKTPAATN